MVQIKKISGRSFCPNRYSTTLHSIFRSVRSMYGSEFQWCSLKEDELEGLIGLNFWPWCAHTEF